MSGKPAAIDGVKNAVNAGTGFLFAFRAGPISFSRTA
jgi:hypothetical protein